MKSKNNHTRLMKTCFSLSYFEILKNSIKAYVIIYKINIYLDFS